jgi:hypothetical protein
MMTRVLFAAIITSLLFASCENKQIIKKYYAGGVLKSETITTKDGRIYKSYDESGKLESEGSIAKDGSRNGKWTNYHLDGTLWSTGNYSDDLKNGLWNYKKKDTSYSLFWNKYINRPLKLNLPQGWIIKDNPTSYASLAVFSDSVNAAVSFSIVLMDGGNVSLDSAVIKSTNYFRSQFNVEQSHLSAVEINGLKGKKLLQTVIMDNKKVKSAQFFLLKDKTIYLLSFVIQPQEESFYNDVIKEIVESFNLI